MSRVIRLNDLIAKLEYIDGLYINGVYYTDDVIEANNNPLVHIDFVDTDIDEYTGSCGTQLYVSYIYYVTTI